MLKMWMFPVLAWMVIGFIVASLTTIVVLPEHSSEMTATGTLTLLKVALGFISQSWRKKLNRTPECPEQRIRTAGAPLSLAWESAITSVACY